MGPQRQEHVYLVTSAALDFVKIGRHTGELAKLVHRYTTYYGRRMELHTWPVECSRHAERVIFSALTTHRVTGELFDKSHLREYLSTIHDVLREPREPSVEPQVKENRFDRFRFRS